MYQLLQLSRCNRKNCLNLFYVCDFWKSEDFQFAFHILCIGSDKIGHDFRNFLKLFFEVKKDIKKDARISPDTVVTVPTSCPVGTRLVHLIIYCCNLNYPNRLTSDGDSYGLSPDTHSFSSWVFQQRTNPFSGMSLYVGVSQIFPSIQLPVHSFN